MDTYTYVVSLLTEVDHRQATLRFIHQDLQQPSSKHESRFAQDSSTTHSATPTSGANDFFTTSSRAYPPPTYKAVPLASTIKTPTQNQSIPSAGTSNPAAKQERENRKQHHTHIRYISYANGIFPTAVSARENRQLKIFVVKRESNASLGKGIGISKESGVRKWYIRNIR